MGVKTLVPKTRGAGVETDKEMNWGMAVGMARTLGLLEQIIGAPFYITIEVVTIGVGLIV